MVASLPIVSLPIVFGPHSDSIVFPLYNSLYRNFVRWMQYSTVLRSNHLRCSTDPVPLNAGII